MLVLVVVVVLVVVLVAWARPAITWFKYRCNKGSKHGADRVVLKSVRGWEGDWEGDRQTEKA